MEFVAGLTVWSALLYACYLQENVEIGEIAAHKLFELEPNNEQNFELLMKIYRKSAQRGSVSEAGGVVHTILDPYLPQLFMSTVEGE
ncbi:hypothetical protein Dsin_028360 [Dipteronia sinensis]|uniref:Uncharacterized protein n=1 Tax=Dipteronia sinensis TaxID=43782 RepID=A0AAE0DUI1_9ROSI|nr:hypothetical protein Dsin_028360 [Dipteronia sinensis]